MPRFVFIGGLLLLLSIPAVLTGWLAYGVTPERSGTYDVHGLSDEVMVSWNADGVPHISARTENDLWAGIGVVHATDHTWSLLLWRQVALGALTQWSGRLANEIPADSLDRHARRLGFGAQARLAYQELGEDERRRLHAYAAGINHAFSSPGVAQQEALVRLGLTLQPWEPWHSLATERLVAYLGTELPPLPASSDSALLRFAASDSLLRSLVGLHSLASARAVVTETTRGHLVAAHQPYGVSGLPLLVEMHLLLRDKAVVAATVPGTTMLPAGRSAQSAWQVFLTSDLALEQTTAPPPPPTHDRLVDAQGDETLLIISRSADGLRLGSASADSLGRSRAWSLTWPGFGAATDTALWSRLLRAEAPGSFSLLRGDGLRATASEITILGTPPAQQRSGGSLLLAATPLPRALSANLANRLSGLADSASADALVLDALSPTARAMTDTLLSALGPRDALPSDIQDAYAFLRGWDGRYTSDEIAPALFQSWLTAHEGVTGQPPLPIDSTEAWLLPYTLRLAHAQLRDHYGPDPSAWRWSQVHSPLRIPVLSEEASGSWTTYHTTLLGHPSTLVPGPPLLVPRVSSSQRHPGPALWSAWGTLDHGTSPTWHIRHPASLFPPPPYRGQSFHHRRDACRSALIAPSNGPLATFPSSRSSLVSFTFPCLTLLS